MMRSQRDLIVPLKSHEQLDTQDLHRVRERLVHRSWIAGCRWLPYSTTQDRNVREISHTEYPPYLAAAYFAGMTSGLPLSSSKTTSTFAGSLTLAFLASCTWFGDCVAVSPALRVRAGAPSGSSTRLPSSM